MQFSSNLDFPEFPILFLFFSLLFLPFSCPFLIRRQNHHVVTNLAFESAWSLATGSLPQCSCVPHLPPKPAIIDDIEASLWIPYTDDGVY